MRKLPFLEIAALFFGRCPAKNRVPMWMASEGFDDTSDDARLFGEGIVDRAKMRGGAARDLLADADEPLDALKMIGSLTMPKRKRKRDFEPRRLERFKVSALKSIEAERERLRILSESVRAPSIDSARELIEEDDERETALGYLLPGIKLAASRALRLLFEAREDLLIGATSHPPEPMVPVLFEREPLLRALRKEEVQDVLVRARHDALRV